MGVPASPLRDATSAHTDDQTRQGNPDQIKWNQIGNTDDQASADQILTAVDRTTNKLEIFALRDGRVRATLPFRAGPSDTQVAHVATSQAELDRGRHYALGLSDDRWRWTRPTRGVPTIVASSAFVTAADAGGGLVLLDSSSGRPHARSPSRRVSRFLGRVHTTLSRAGQTVSYPVLMRLVVNRVPIRRPDRGHRVVLAAALAASAALVLSACSASTSTGNGATSKATSPSSSATSPSTDPTTSTPSASPNKAAADAAPVHVSLLEGDGGVYGVGMPIIAYVDRAVTDATAFDKATTVTVNGKPAAGAWYWEKSGRKGQALEAHYRLSRYWPANAEIFMDLPVKGLSAGKGLAFDDSLTLSISTGPAHVSTVDCAAEKMTVTSNAKTVRTMPVSCGKAKTPTYTGTKVVMQKGEQVPGSDKLRPEGTVRMVSTDPADPYDLMVPWSVRLTNSGEYAHAASWNGGNIGIRSTSNGCTNLNVSDAKWFYQFSQLGDVVTYANTGGSRMPSWDGYGDWNLPWTAWQAGGIVPSGN